MISASNREAAALWSAALDRLAGRVSPRTRAALLAATAPLELLPTSLRVAARSSEIRAWIGSGAIALLRRAVHALTDGVQELALAAVAEGAELVRDPRLQFASFIVSPSNSAARDRARGLATGAGAAPAVALLHGPRGSGKTHLLRCAAAALRDRFPAGVLSLSGEGLVLHLIEALWRDELEAFRARLHGAHALLIDGLEALEGREATQVELADAIDAAQARAAPVILTSARPAQQLNQLIPSLAERLAAAEGLELAVPGWEARAAIVIERVSSWGVRASPEIAAHLAAYLRSDLDRLDAVLTTLLAESGAGLEDLVLVQQILEENERPGPRPTPEHVIQLVARHFGVRLRDLRSRGRSPRTATPRQVAMYLLRRVCGLSYPEVGRHFRRHHTTALHSDRLVRRRLEQDPGLRSAVVLLDKELRNHRDRGR